MAQQLLEEIPYSVSYPHHGSLPKNFTETHPCSQECDCKQQPSPWGKLHVPGYPPGEVWGFSLDISYHSPSSESKLSYTEDRSTYSLAGMRQDTKASQKLPEPAASLTATRRKRGNVRPSHLPRGVWFH